MSFNPNRKNSTPRPPPSWRRGWFERCNSRDDDVENQPPPASRFPSRARTVDPRSLLNWRQPVQTPFESEIAISTTEPSSQPVICFQDHSSQAEPPQPPVDIETTTSTTRQLDRTVGQFQDQALAAQPLQTPVENETIISTSQRGFRPTRRFPAQSLAAQNAPEDNDRSAFQPRNATNFNVDALSALSINDTSKKPTAPSYDTASQASKQSDFKAVAPIPSSSKSKDINQVIEIKKTRLQIDWYCSKEKEPKDKHFIQQEAGEVAKRVSQLPDPAVRIRKGIHPETNVRAADGQKLLMQDPNGFHFTVEFEYHRDEWVTFRLYVVSGMDKMYQRAWKVRALSGTLEKDPEIYLDIRSSKPLSDGARYHGYALVDF